MALVSSPDWVLVQLSRCSWTACRSSVKPHPLPCHWSMMKNTGRLGSRHVCKENWFANKLTFTERSSFPRVTFAFIRGRPSLLPSWSSLVALIAFWKHKYKLLHLLVVWNIIFNMHLQVLETYLKQLKQHVEQVWGNVHSLDGFLRSLCYIKK